MKNLWSANTPKAFWQCETGIGEEDWEDAIRRSANCLNLEGNPAGIDAILAQTLGEGQFGADHWTLSPVKRMYYFLKPYLPRSLTRFLRRLTNPLEKELKVNWPIESRYCLFQWEVMRQLLLITGKQSIHFKHFWPQGRMFALTMTHDIETAEGQRLVHKVIDLEEKFGIRSSFNFVLDRYKIDMGLMDELNQRGFEVGCHGLKHDGKLFNSKTTFLKRAKEINLRMKQHNMVGFRAPLTHRNPEWMQALDIEYDLSFFDTDPFEPISGGTMSIWPFFLGRFIELPYTLVQDYSLTAILGETTPRIWLDKIQYIKKYFGMALVNTHPDYLFTQGAFKIYEEFLRSLETDKQSWRALPRDVASWWRQRVEPSKNGLEVEVRFGTAYLEDDKLCLEI